MLKLAGIAAMSEGRTCGVTRERKGEHLHQGVAFWGRQIEVGRLRNIYKMSNVSGC